MPAAAKTTTAPPKKATTPRLARTIVATEKDSATKTAPPKETCKVPPNLEVEQRAAQPAPTNAVPAKLKNTPDWKVWGKRPVISLRHAISLVHNIHTSGATLERLKAKKDQRTKKFNVDLNTLRLSQPFESSLPAVKPVINKVSNDTEIFLADFVDWIQTKNPFDHLTIPSEFLELKPPRPGKDLVVTPSTGGNIADAPAVKTRISASNASEFVGKEKKTVSRILLALATKHYGYRPRSVTQEGVFAPISKLCKTFNLEGIKNWETVKSVLAHATSALDEREIDMLLAVLDDAKTHNATISQPD